MSAQTPQNRMRAVLQAGYGEADVLSIAETARPSIDEREVLVEVRAAGIDRGTWHLMAGLPYAIRLFSGLRHPKNEVPGLDVAGVVVAVGAAVRASARAMKSSGSAKARSPSSPRRARTNSPRSHRVSASSRPPPCPSPGSPR